MSQGSGRSDVFVTSFPEGRGKVTISTDGGMEPRWRADERELYYRALDGTVMAVPVRTSPSFEAGLPAAVGAAASSHYAVTGDGRRFLLVIPTGDKPVSTPITVVLNWTSVLRK